MKLETVINHSMIQYPGLYKCCLSDNLEKHTGNKRFCPIQSRLLVLNHLFLVNGTGMSWHRDGFMAHTFYDEKADEDLYEIFEHRELPDGYFDRDFFNVEVNDQKADSFRSEFAGSIVYEVKECRVSGKNMVFFFVDMNISEKDKSRAMAFSSCSDKKPRSQCMRHMFSPYPICEFSGLAQAVIGKAYEGFDFSPQKDWAAGVVEIARETIDYYSDEKRYSSCQYYPENVLWRTFDMDVYKMGEEQALKKWKSREDAHRLFSNSFENIKKQQIEYCESAINKLA